MAPRSIISRRALSLLSTAFVLGILGVFTWLYRYGYVDAGSLTRPPLLPVGGVGDTKAAVHTLSLSSSSSSPSLATVSSISASRLKPAPVSTSSTTEPNLAATPQPSSAAHGAPTVRLTQGTYVGIILPQSKRYPRTVEAFRGVPYAETTTGQNRFRPPVPVGESDLTFDAGEFGQVCPISLNSASNEGESCLNANIYRLASNATASGSSPPAGAGKLPVVIYVHGGGFNGGSGIERNMASFISWARHPLIAVNFNYRTGALGFLPSALTAREGLLNLGLKDQQMLFQWVQKNIAAFGGDPDNVTLMGQSAGAHSIGHHIMHYTSENAPFHKAILESGATTARSVLMPTHPRHLVQFREFLVQAGVEGAWEDNIMENLRGLPLKTIVNASATVWERYQDDVCWPFQPVIDGLSPGAADSAPIPGALSSNIIADLPILSWRHGNHLRIPIITGFNTNEGAMFVPFFAETDTEFRSFFSALIPGMNDTDFNELGRLYPEPPATTRRAFRPPKGSIYTPGRQWARMDAAYGDYAYITPVLQTAHFMSRAGNSSAANSRHFLTSTHQGGRPPTGKDKDKPAGKPAARQRSPSASASASASPAPVYVYHYAGLSTARGTTIGVTNHGDEAALVAHDMYALGDAPGLGAIADAMNGAWVRFIVSPDGNPNYNPAGLEAAEEDGGMVEWPAFESPFGGEVEEEAGGRVAARGNTSGGGKWKGNGEGEDGVGTGKGRGKIVVFGEGNDERMGDRHRNAGVVARVASLEEGAGALERYRFWWQRAELSEGLGKREGSTNHTSNIKLDR